jgi:hypothetical protein
MVEGLNVIPSTVLLLWEPAALVTVLLEIMVDTLVIKVTSAQVYPSTSLLLGELVALEPQKSGIIVCYHVITFIRGKVACCFAGQVSLIIRVGSF